MHSPQHPALDCFSPDYFSARARFLALARERGARIASYPIEARGPAGEPLSIDTAYLGAAAPQRLLVITSGTHGVEGSAGSALQSQWLDRFAPARIPDDGGRLLIHAVNPYGFAWLRRANEHNVDLNRNALERFPGPPNSAYAQLDAWLNPPSPPHFPDFFLLRGAWRVLRLGWSAVQQAIVEGQYEFPQGLFYGGTRTEASTAHLAAILADEAFQHVRRVFAIDIHTGLGRFATYKLMVDVAEDSAAYRELAQRFGPQALASSRPRSSLAYRVSGGLAELIERRLGGARTHAAVLEFGTIPPARLLATLRRENRAHHYTRPHSEALKHAREALREACCPSSPHWRRRILADGARVFEQAERACFEPQ